MVSGDYQVAGDDGGAVFQQEAFINVQFHMPAARLDGPPIFHSSARWVILDRRGRVPQK